MAKRRRPLYLTATAMKVWRVLNSPEACPILEHPEFDPVVDHNHKTGLVRGVISRQGNSLVGKIENFFRSRCGCSEADLPTALRNAADYLEKRDLPLLHPRGITQLANRFKSKKVEIQRDMLERMGVPWEAILQAKNSKQRVKLFRDVLTYRKYKPPT